MKHRFALALYGLLGSILSAAAGPAYPVGNAGPGFIQGPNGKLSVVLQLPRGFEPDSDRCNLVILMHGVMSNKNIVPIPRIAGKLVKAGYAVLRFDFNGQGKSEGDVLSCTVPSEIDDAMAVYEYACTLPFVDKIVLAGHSQGGAVAGMLAGRLSSEAGGAEGRGAEGDGVVDGGVIGGGAVGGDAVAGGVMGGGAVAGGDVAGGTVVGGAVRRAPDALVLLAPGGAIKDFALEGSFLGVHCDPVNPPDYVQVYWYKFSKEYILTAQKLQIYEESAPYSGPVLVLHGTADKVIPLKYSALYNVIYPSCEYVEIPGERHLLTNHPREVDSAIISFLSRAL
jgi:pimeloyl-ACP methyl ester carboxylesterase